MPFRICTTALLISGLTTVLAASAAQAAQLQVAVSGVAEARGHIRVDVCTAATFAKSKAACPYSGAAPAQPGTTVVTINNVPPGQYAAQVFHDLTDQGVVHQNFLGIPREPIGFSNDASVGLTGPKFHDAAFNLRAETLRIMLKLRRIGH